jgi:hypothetical protein
LPLLIGNIEKIRGFSISHPYQALNSLRVIHTIFLIDPQELSCYTNGRSCDSQLICSIRSEDSRAISILN